MRLYLISEAPFGVLDILFQILNKFHDFLKLFSKFHFKITINDFEILCGLTFSSTILQNTESIHVKAFDGTQATKI